MTETVERLLTVGRVATRRDFEAIRILLEEYLAAQVPNYPDPNAAASRFRKEVEELEARYAPPAGGLFLARFDGDEAGCVGYAALGAYAEMRRLYVREEYRCQGIGRALAKAVIAAAAASGYSAMRLDVYSSRFAAIALYGSLGFEAIPAYEYQAIDFDLLYFELPLAASG